MKDGKKDGMTDGIRDAMIVEMKYWVKGGFGLHRGWNELWDKGCDDG